MGTTRSLLQSMLDRFVSAIVLLFFDYCDIISSDRKKNFFCIPSRFCTIRRLRLLSFVLCTPHLLRRSLSTFGGSIFVFPAVHSSACPYF